MTFRIALAIGRSNRTLSAWNLRELGDKRCRFFFTAHRDFGISPFGSLRPVLIVETFQAIFATPPAYRMSQKRCAFE